MTYSEILLRLVGVINLIVGLADLFGGPLWKALLCAFASAACLSLADAMRKERLAYHNEAVPVEFEQGPDK